MRDLVIFPVSILFPIAAGQELFWRTRMEPQATGMNESMVERFS